MRAGMHACKHTCRLGGTIRPREARGARARKRLRPAPRAASDHDRNAGPAVLARPRVARGRAQAARLRAVQLGQRHVRLTEAGGLNCLARVHQPGHVLLAALDQHLRQPRLVVLAGRRGGEARGRCARRCAQPAAKEFVRSSAPYACNNCPGAAISRVCRDCLTDGDGTQLAYHSL